MIPLTFANIGENMVIKKIGGSPEVKKHLEAMGFVAGSDVSIINAFAGNVIVNIKQSRVAISNEMAKKIMV